jgi:hypothetical protein
VRGAQGKNRLYCCRHPLQYAVCSVAH